MISGCMLDIYACERFGALSFSRCSMRRVSAGVMIVV